MASGPSKRKRQNGAPLRQKMRYSLNVPKSTSRSVAPSSLRSIHSDSSFKIYQRKEFVRELEVPGMMYHILYTFKMIFKNWKLFLPFLLIMVAAAILFVGLMSENTYQQFQAIIDQASEESGANIGTFAKSGILLVSTAFTGGLSVESSNAGAGIFVSLIFLIIWLVTIFIFRHVLAGQVIKLRDALYNAMTPLLSTFVVLVVAMVQCIPIILLLVAYSAAVETKFLTAPVYIIMFLVFAALMILLSFYLLSGTIMALVAVSAPGLYPLEALRTASDLMAGRRIRFILRIVALIITLVIMWAVVMMPLIMLDMALGQFEWTAQIPFIPVCLVIMTCFSGIYVAAYFYFYYRWMLKFDTEPEKKR